MHMVLDFVEHYNFYIKFIFIRLYIKCYKFFNVNGLDFTAQSNHDPAVKTGVIVTTDV